MILKVFAGFKKFRNFPQPKLVISETIDLSSLKHQKYTMLYSLSALKELHVGMLYASE